MLANSKMQCGANKAIILLVVPKKLSDGTDQTQSMVSVEIQYKSGAEVE